MPAAVVQPALVAHLCGVTVTPVPPSPAGPGLPLPPTLIVPPGVYRFQGRDYDLAREGLYRFLQPPKETQQRLVYRQDVGALLSAVCWLHSHGYREDGRKHDEALQQALTGKLIMTCANVSRFAQRLCTDLGVPARVVNSRSLGPRNGYDDGHVLMEVRLGQRWVLVDVDQHVTFRHRDQRLSLLELYLHLDKDDYRLEALALSVPLAVGNFVDAGDHYDYAIYLETMVHSEATLRGWYRHIIGMPVIAGCYTLATAADREQVERVWPERSETYLPRPEFERRFYQDAAGPR